MLRGAEGSALRDMAVLIADSVTNPSFPGWLLRKDRHGGVYQVGSRISSEQLLDVLLDNKNPSD